MRVDVWSDIACPWCYIGKRRFETALERWEHADDVEVVWHSFQLDPSIPEHYDGTEVDYLVSRKGMAEPQVRQMIAMVSQEATKEGLDYDFDNLVVANSLAAHRLLHVAARQGLAGEVKEALLRAHFVEARDVGSVDELVAIGTAAGLDADQIRAGLDDPQVADEVQADFDAARRLGINGVPFFVLDNRFAVSGAQKPAVFEQALTQAWQASAPLVPVGSQDAAACGPDGCAI